MDQQRVLMIGVKDDEFARQLSERLEDRTGRDRVAWLQEVKLKEEAEDDQRKAMARCRVAIVGEGQFEKWVKWPRRAEGDGEVTRPPHYVLVGEFAAHRQDDKYLEDPGTLGYGTAQQLESVVDEIAGILEGPMDDGRDEGECIEVRRGAASGDGDARRVSFGGLRCGRTGRALLELRRTARSLGPREGGIIDKARVDLFRKVQAREWLDRYVDIQSAVPPESRADLFKTRVSDTSLKKFLGPPATALPYNRLVVEAFQKLFMEAHGPTDAVLVLGETGTGKSIAAWELHRLRAKRMGMAAEALPFRQVNCSGLASLDSIELFGAMKGAYTDSSVTNPGAVLSAYGGTVFLDEFGNLSARGQENLLVFLEDGAMKPLGWWDRSMRVPTMLVAATNERLTDRIAAGEFREDLYRRFRSRILTLPPLREIKDDELWYFVDDLIERENRTGEKKKIIKGVTQEALDKLRNHDYPGNVRELEGILAKAVRRAREAGRRRIVKSDVEFEASTLPGVDVVTAMIRDSERRVLLRWARAWEQWFFPARLVGEQRVGQCLQEELRERFQVAADHVERAEMLRPDRRFETVRRGVSAFRLIQYSRRDRKTKHYHFYLYDVVLKPDRLEELRCRLDGWGDCKWVSEEALRTGAIRHASETVVALLRQLPATAGQVN